MSSAYPPFASGPAQPCQRCGQPLSSNEAQCRNCGYNNAYGFGQPPSGPSWGNSAPSAPFGANSMAGTPWGQAAAQSVGNNNPFGGASSPQPPYNSNHSYGNPAQPYYGSAASQQPFYAQPSSQSGNSFAQTAFAASSPPMGGLQPGGNNYQPETFAQPPQKKKGAKLGLILGIVALLMVVIGGGLFAYTSLKKTPASTSPTPRVVATPTPKGQAVFADAFTDNKHGWDTTSKSGAFSVNIGGGSLALEDDDHHLLWELVPTTQHFNDFYLTVDANLSKGSQSNGYGVYIRGSLNQNDEIATYYRFELYGDGTFAIFKGAVDATGTPKNTTLINYTPNTSILKQGQTNHLAINAKGPMMTFSVNGQLLATVTDNTYTSGSIALFVSNFPNTTAGAQATFTNLAIYPPQ